MSSNSSQEKANTVSLTVNMAPVDGDCFIVQLPNQKIMLIDAGEGESRQIVFNQLDKLGIKHIDYLVGTHQHSDHMWNFKSIINRYSIGEILFPGGKAPTNGNSYQNMKEAADAAQIPIKKVTDGDELFPAEQISGIELKTLVMAPNKNADYDAVSPNPPKSLANDYSLVFSLRYGTQGILFTGDAYEPAMTDVKANHSLKGLQVLKASHHGFGGTTVTDAFMKRMQPELQMVLIPNKTGTPGFRTRLQALGLAYWGSSSGEMWLKTDGTKWWSSKPPEWSPSS